MLLDAPLILWYLWYIVKIWFSWCNPEQAKHQRLTTPQNRWFMRSSDDFHSSIEFCKSVYALICNKCINTLFHREIRGCSQHAAELPTAFQTGKSRHRSGGERKKHLMPRQNPWLINYFAFASHICTISQHAGVYSVRVPSARSQHLASFRRHLVR